MAPEWEQDLIFFSFFLVFFLISIFFFPLPFFLFQFQLIILVLAELAIVFVGFSAYRSKRSFFP